MASHSSRFSINFFLTASSSASCVSMSASVLTSNASFRYSDVSSAQRLRASVLRAYCSRHSSSFCWWENAACSTRLYSAHKSMRASKPSSMPFTRFSIVNFLSGGKLDTSSWPKISLSVEITCVRPFISSSTALSMLIFACTAAIESNGGSSATTVRTSSRSAVRSKPPTLNTPSSSSWGASSSSFVSSPPLLRLILPGSSPRNNERRDFVGVSAGGSSLMLCRGLPPMLCRGLALTLCRGLAPTLCRGLPLTLCRGVARLFRGEGTLMLCRGMAAMSV
mmetsp:Transcript_28446/g.70700  ORF Transcript_28446/g.70700 Transcript_28446/m.70700 type:complete len:279 (-) Transcript_28446:1358-2194(-)